VNLFQNELKECAYDSVTLILFILTRYSQLYIKQSNEKTSVMALSPHQVERLYHHDSVSKLSFVKPVHNGKVRMLLKQVRLNKRVPYPYSDVRKRSRHCLHILFHDAFSTA